MRVSLRTVSTILARCGTADVQYTLGSDGRSARRPDIGRLGLNSGSTLIVAAEIHLPI